MVKIGVLGATGRMGRELIMGCQDRDDMTVGAAIDHPDSPFLGQDSGLIAMGSANGVPVSADLEAVAEHCEVLIDFTRPEVTLSVLPKCVRLSIPLVIGTTGFTDAEKSELTSSAMTLPIVFAPNMSPGVNLMFKLVQLAAKALHEESDIEILEAHHRGKVDAPSGTALKLGELVAEASGVSLDDAAVYAREGQSGPRMSKEIGFATIRGGDIVGEHTVLFAGAGERLEITHKASHRKNFAQGALRAAVWLTKKQPGLYTMEQVLDL